MSFVSPVLSPLSTPLGENSSQQEGVMDFNSEAQSVTLCALKKSKPTKSLALLSEPLREDSSQQEGVADFNFEVQSVALCALEESKLTRSLAWLSKLMDRLFYRLYSVLHPPTLIPMHRFYGDPYMRKMYGGAKKLKGYEQVVKHYRSLSAHRIEGMGRLTHHSIKCIEEFADPEVRLARAEGFLASRLAGKEYESREMNWTVPDLCGDEIEELWTEKYREKFLEQEKAHNRILQSFNRDHIKNQETLAEHRQVWEKMATKQRLYSICCSKKTMCVMAVVALVAFIFGRFYFSKNKCS